VTATLRQAQGLYAGNDARINATLPATQAAMQKLVKSYDVRTYEGAGHGFMFGQGGAGGANLKAAQESWPVLVQFFRESTCHSASLVRDPRTADRGPRVLSCPISSSSR